MAHRRGGQPADAIEFADGLDWILLESGADRYQGEGGPSQDATAYRHGGGCNVVYWDGHADRRPRAEVVANDRLWQAP